MTQGSGVIELDLYSRLVDGRYCGVDSISVRVFVLNFFDGSPSSNIGLSYVGTIIGVMIFIVAIVAVIVTVVTIVLTTMIIAAITVGVGFGVGIGIGVGVVVPGWALIFFGAPFGPAFGFHMSKVVAIVAFDFAHVMLLRACGESFLIVVFVLHGVAIVFIGDEKGDLGWCDGDARGVSNGVKTT